MSKYYINIRIIAMIMLSAGVAYLLVPQFLKAQTIYRLFAVKDMVVKVTGTSNLNDWSMTSMESKSRGSFEFGNNGQLIRLSALNFSIPVRSLRSGDSTMDKRAYKELKADQFPNITFTLDSSVIKMIQKNSYDLTAKGTLTIGGVSRMIHMKVNGVLGTNNTISFRGSKRISLSDYQIKSPGMMFGVFKVNDSVTVNYILTYNK